MAKFRLKGRTYVCEDEDRLAKELVKRGVEGTTLIQEQVDLETVRIVLNELIWYATGKVIDQIVEEVRDLVRRE